MSILHVMENFDIVIIGSGGGSKLTRPAADMGLKVAIIEKSDLGGTCLNRGCIPSKMLIHPADVLTEIDEAKKFRINIESSPKVDVEALVTDVTRVVQEESNSIAPLYESHPNITYFSQEARFVSNKVIEVGGVLISGDKIFIAVGARPFIPPIQGLIQTPFWTSTEALQVKTMPKRLCILGGGYIACELGYYFQKMGVEVTFLVRRDILRHLDDDIQTEFSHVFSNHHQLICGAVVSDVSFKDDLFTLTYEQDDDVHTLTSEALLVATGIRPNSDTLGLQHTDINVDDKGFIKVNDYMQTAVKDVYAFGDVIGRYFFRHSANFEGEFLFNTVVKDQHSVPISYPPVPYAVFTHPQVSGVGVTESECEEEGRSIIVASHHYAASAMGMALQSDHGLVKLIFDLESRVLIGAHIVGREASIMSHMLIAFMVMHATIDDMSRMIYVHPALPEIIRNAVRKALSQFDALKKA